MTVETIPLPRDEIEERNEFQVRVTDVEAWPEQEIVVSFEFNDLMDRWLWEMRTTRMGVVISKSVCTLGYDYSIWPYMMARFEDTTDSETRVRSRNLGDEIKLCVYPGPLGGSFLDEANISQSRENQILKRHWFDPVG